MLYIKIAQCSGEKCKQKLSKGTQMTSKICLLFTNSYCVVNIISRFQFNTFTLLLYFARI